MPTVGRKGKGNHVQSVIFAKAAGWDRNKSYTWCKDHKHYTDGHEETDDSHRWRQYDPEPGRFRYRSQSIKRTADGKSSVTLINGHPKSSGAKQQGDEEMSTVGKIRELEDQVKTLTAALEASETAKVAAEQGATEMQKAVDAAQAERVELEAGFKAQIDELNTKITELTAQVETISADRDKEKARADSAETKLKNPAFEHASVAGGEPIDDPAVVNATGEQTPCWNEYERLRRAGNLEKAAIYYREHEKEIKLEQQAVVGRG